MDIIIGSFVTLHIKLQLPAKGYNIHRRSNALCCWIYCCK